MLFVGVVTDVSVEHWWAGLVEACWYWVASSWCLVQWVSLSSNIVGIISLGIWLRYCFCRACWFKALGAQTSQT